MSEIIGYGDDEIGDKERCFNCKFYVKNKSINDDEAEGNCYRYPPTSNISAHIAQMFSAAKEFEEKNNNGFVKTECGEGDKKIELLNDLSGHLNDEALDENKSWLWDRPIVFEFDYCGEFVGKV